ncbi:MAG: hypothetical protein ACKV2U_18590 [Bryobacteraceae bacterium]
MPTYRIFRMKEQSRLSFRAAPHTSGETAVKLKDYVEAGPVEAVNAYEAWELLRATDRPLEVGDILESELGGIQICKYIGFDDAKWIVPEVKSTMEGVPITGGVPTPDFAAGKL